MQDKKQTGMTPTATSDVQGHVHRAVTNEAFKAQAAGPTRSSRAILSGLRDLQVEPPEACDTPFPDLHP
jgi:hypothetical protein